MIHLEPQVIAAVAVNAALWAVHTLVEYKQREHEQHLLMLQAKLLIEIRDGMKNNTNEVG